MSKTKNNVVTTLNVFEDVLRSRIYRRKGVKLTIQQNHIYCDSLVLLLCCWYDCIQPKTSVAKPRWALPWVRVISLMEVDKLAEVLKLTDNYLLQNVHNSLRDFDRFKRDLTQVIPETGQVLAPLKGLFQDLIDHQMYDHQDPDSRRVFYDTSKDFQASFSLLHTCLGFMSRLNLKGLIDLESEAYAAYVEGERVLQTEDFSDEETSIIQSWFPYVQLVNLLNDWHPKHGGGSVADTQSRCKEAKYHAFGRDSMIDRLDLILGGNTMPVVVNDKLDRASRVVFVPKSISKLRTICMEPATLQWYQQGFLRSLIKYINAHDYLRRRIDLYDQELSRDMAFEGSIDGCYATIDLSSASDSVSWSLVKKWTRRSSLLPIFGLTRSKECVLPGGLRMVTKKFAPMGSALCFPAECIIFCAIVEAAILDVGGRPRDSKYRVYGDDIIVEEQYAPAVMARLSRNGFTVNTAKSFWLRHDTHNFRESCGGEFLDAVDVTPIRLSRRFAGYSDVYDLNASSIAACVDLCNLCYNKLPTVRRFVIKALLELP